MELRLLFGSMHSQAGAWERGKKINTRVKAYDKWKSQRS
jgi:hypothetical protein